MENTASLTALISSFGRAYHVENDTPIIFNDILSRKLMTDDEYKQIKDYMLGGIDFFAPDKKASFYKGADILKWIVQTQIAPTPLARARYCEDSLKTAMLTGTTQYVILGAGMDTFAFRNLDEIKKICVFEVDHPLTQCEKQKRISYAELEIPDNLNFVPMDFTKDNLADKLLQSGYRKEKKTFFSWLGVSYYLTVEQIENVLKSLKTFAAEGSSILFDYATEDILNSPIKRVQNMIAMAAAAGEPIKSYFSYKELERMLSKYDFLIYELLETSDIQKKYFINRTDYLKAFEHIQYVLAVLK